MSEISFKEPYLLLICLAIPLYYVVNILFWKRTSLWISSLSIFYSKTSRLRSILVNSIDILKVIALMLLGVAAAQPFLITTSEEKHYEGISIVIVLDISGSMLADDFKPNRLEVAKQKAKDFILARKGDNIGLVAYAGEAYIVSPITRSKDFLIEQIDRIRTGLIDDGTAIGNGLASGINLIKDIDSDAKVIILLSDGVNNAGQIDPLLAASIAELYDIKVYTIGIGTQSTAKVPEHYDGSGNLLEVAVELDSQTLMSISSVTGGKYFEAATSDALSAIYDEINKIELTKEHIEIIKTEVELFHYFVISAILLLILHFVLRTTKFRIA